MSRIIANNIRHNDATVDNITLDSAGNATVDGTLTATSFSGDGSALTGIAVTSVTGNLTVTSGNLILSSGNGIDFSATANSSGTMTSELLDDYERGTYTVTITPNTGSIALQWWGETATYTKIGNVIHACGIVTVASNTSATGYYRINLPFASNSVEGSSVYVTFDALATGYTTNSFNADIYAGQNSIRVWNGTASSTSSAGAAAQALQNGTEIKFSATYII